MRKRKGSIYNLDSMSRSDNENVKALSKILTVSTFSNYSTISWPNKNYVVFLSEGERYLLPVSNVTAYFNQEGSHTFEMSIDFDKLQILLEGKISEIIENSYKKLNKVKTKSKDRVSKTVKEEVKDENRS